MPLRAVAIAAPSRLDGSGRSHQHRLLCGYATTAPWSPSLSKLDGGYGQAATFNIPCTEPTLIPSALAISRMDLPASFRA